MRIAFVGIKRDYWKLDEDYIPLFNKFHLEIPWYFAELGEHDVVVTTTNYTGNTFGFIEKPGTFQNITEKEFSYREFDVVIHWRSWSNELYKPKALNFMHTCDHSYSPEWISDVRMAIHGDILKGIFCHEGWHKEQMMRETHLAPSVFLTGYMQGVDTDVFKPAENKDPYQMLWASDPGRGMQGALSLANELFRIDKKFQLNLCAPDYSFLQSGIAPIPAWKFHGNLKNSEKLWNLFNTCGIFPYTSTFPEPSSRAYRQAQAAGCMVLYPPNMGSPSGYIRNGVDGIVAPVSEWKDIILENIRTGEWKEIGRRAREFALSENWEVQTKRFNKFMENYK